MNIVIVLFLVAFSGLFSGLTLGLLGLDKSELQRKISIGNKDAEKIYQVRENGNLLLCTLLLGNVAVNSALSIFLGNIASGLLGGIIATLLITVFGEIIPQATCSRYAMQIGAKTVWLVKLFMFILYPFCWPISWILDKVLGEEMPTIWSRDELKEIIKLHEKSKESEVNIDEERIVMGALSFSEKKVSEVMTPRTMVFALEVNKVLDDKTLLKIKEGSFNRIPVYREKMDNIEGILYAKNLIGVKGGEDVKKLMKQELVLKVRELDELNSVLNLLIKEKKHLALVYNNFGTFLGVVSLEDILEEVLRREIVDEDDVVVDLQKEALKKASV